MTISSQERTTASLTGPFSIKMVSFHIAFVLHLFFVPQLEVLYSFTLFFVPQLEVLYSFTHVVCSPARSEEDISCTIILVFSFSSRWHRSPRKGPYTLRPVSQQSPQGCPRNNDNICLVEHRSFSAVEGGLSAASFLHSS